MDGWTRRSLLAAAPALGLAPSAGAQDLSPRQDRVGEPLTPWRPGKLDIHHLSTGRGDATLIVGPDGTTILIDAGAASRIDAATLPARPNGDRRPGEWIARYIRRRLVETGRDGLDTLVVTHLHPDHIGGVSADSPLKDGGLYRLTGVSDIAAQMPIERIIDPDFPNYGYPPFEDAISADNYVAFIRARVTAGERVERFQVGRADQIRLERGGSGPAFQVRNIASRGRVWTGSGDEATAGFPGRSDLTPADYPGENASSVAIRLRFGAFRYFAAGDLTDWANAGARPWLDALTPAAAIAGPVDAAIVPHHGLFDASGSAAVRALAAKVWIISAWHASHPSPSTLERLFEPRLYPGPRSVYSTDVSPAADLVAARLTARLASRQGHVILRVDADGQAFRTVVTSAADEDDRITEFGPSVLCTPPVPRGVARQPWSFRWSDFDRSLQQRQRR